MFTWVCPQCGREVPPHFTECPDCKKAAANPPQPDQPPAPLAFDHAEILNDYLHFLRTGEFPAPWRK